MRKNILTTCGAIMVILCSNFIQWIPFDPDRRPDPFEQASMDYKVDVDLLRAVAYVENQKADPYAISSSGAIGIMQIMPKTGEWACGLSRSELFNRAKNIRCGAMYLSYLGHQIRRKYGERLDLVLAAYNAGPGHVDYYRRVPPFPETQQYIPKVMKRLKELKNARNAPASK